MHVYIHIHIYYTHTHTHSVNKADMGSCPFCWCIHVPWTVFVLIGANLSLCFARLCVGKCVCVCVFIIQYQSM